MTAVEILEKHGIKPNKNARAKAALEKAVKDRAKAKGSVKVDGPTIADRELQEKIYHGTVTEKRSRNDLMKMAQEKGIKYFRILTKVELQKVLDPATIQQEIDGVIDDAKKRWKAGWKSK